MKSVAVHNGKFHADDVFAIAILRKIYPDLQLIRSRDPEVLASVDARVDVGMHYNPETLDFDHHQGEGAGERENGTPYASVGLIWKHYGMQLVHSEFAWDVIDKSLIQPLDADDCGVATYEKIGKISPYTIPKIIAKMNPNWKGTQNHDEQFDKAVELATIILNRELLAANNLDEANVLTQKAIDSREQPEYIILDTYCPWKKTVEKYDEILYIIFPGKNQWCVTTTSEIEFQPKKPFPQSWRGLEGKELEKASGLNGVEFCHKTGFFLAAKTKENAIEAVKKSLEQ